MNAPDFDQLFCFFLVLLIFVWLAFYLYIFHHRIRTDMCTKMSIKLIKLLNANQAKYLLIDFNMQFEAHINSHFSRLIAANQLWSAEAAKWCNSFWLDHHPLPSVMRLLSNCRHRILMW